MKGLFTTLLKLFLLITAVGALGFLCLGFIVSYHGAAPVKSDVIIVLGGDSGRRVQHGASLYKEGYGARVLLTGIDRRFYRKGHLNWRERRMKALGVPLNAVLIDTQSETTWEEAVNSSALMKKRGWRTALVVSDPPHMLRLQKTWETAFEGTGFTFVLTATKPEWWDPFIWWRNPISYRFVISEVKKNLFYAVMYY
ncbi:MAG: YdcF family protein [Chlorobium sp.]|nr:YdcF family protein [Chlorobium phaeovibrioides]NQU46576.1 YdcF family protein [Chlorobium sp.]